MLASHGDKPLHRFYRELVPKFLLFARAYHQ